MLKNAANIARFILGSIMLGLLLFALLCCSPQKQLNRLVKNHPELLKKDTLTVHDTTVIPGFKVDTLISFFDAVHDTIYITKNNVTTKLLLKVDSVYLSTEAKADTVIKYIKVPYKYIQPVTEKWYQSGVMRYLFTAMLLGCGLFFLFKQKS